MKNDPKYPKRICARPKDAKKPARSSGPKTTWRSHKGRARRFQMLRNDRARVIEMLDESRGIHEVERLGRERRQGKVLTNDAARHPLQSEIGAQQPAAAPGEVSAEHLAAQLPTEIG